MEIGLKIHRMTGHYDSVSRSNEEIIIFSRQYIDQQIVNVQKEEITHENNFIGRARCR